MSLDSQIKQLKELILTHKSGLLSPGQVLVLTQAFPIIGLLDQGPGKSMTHQ